MTNLKRRKFLITAGVATAGTVILHGCTSGGSSSSSGGGATSGNTKEASSTASASNAPKVETTKAKLGFIPLTDSAPIIIAKEKGLFEKYGMKDVEVVKQKSWPVTRDNLKLGSEKGGIDGAHILTPMPYLMTVNDKVNMYILARLNLNGQGISVEEKLKNLKINKESKGLKSAGGTPKVAMTFPGGTHDLWMRYWLAAGGIDPDKDVVLEPVPPPQMVANMKVGTVQAFCVGEPWNAQLVSQKLGYTAMVTGEMWNDHPEKAFTMRADWVDKNPNAAQALVMAIQEAQQWCDKPENKAEMCKICAGRKYFNIAQEDILERAKGNIDYGDGRKEENFKYAMKFWADNASYPYKSHDTWFLTENIRWGKLPKDTKVKELVEQVNKEDIWKKAAQALGVPADQIPTSTSRGVETFFDGVKFDPEKPEEYLNSLKIKKA